MNTAHWIPTEETNYGYRIYRCSNCNAQELGGHVEFMPQEPPVGTFCRWCGKEMERGADDE